MYCGTTTSRTYHRSIPEDSARPLDYLHFVHCDWFASSSLPIEMLKTAQQERRSEVPDLPADDRVSALSEADSGSTGQTGG